MENTAKVCPLRALAWEKKYFPLKGKAKEFVTCLEDCAWRSDDNCAILKIADMLDILSNIIDGISLLK